MSMAVTINDRGFAIVEFLDGNDVPCSLQKSSAAERDMIWFGCGNNRMHLAREHVSTLLPFLHYFVATGELGASPSPMPVIEEYDRVIAGILPEAFERDGDEADFVMRVCDYQLLRAAAITKADEEGQSCDEQIKSGVTTRPDKYCRMGECEVAENGGSECACLKTYKESKT